MEINSVEISKGREKYAYIPGKLIKSTNSNPDFQWEIINAEINFPNSEDVTSWGSSLSLDEYHQNLLLSENDSELLLGFCSVVFWGYFSGSDGIVRKERALSKVRVLRDGRSGQNGNSLVSVLGHLKSARIYVKSGDLGRALLELMKIRYIGMSFASKIVMFMNPSIAAVYDSVISERLKQYPELEYLYVKVVGATDKEKTRQCEIYIKWCEFCANTAKNQNDSGAVWIDWNSKEQVYRAVDIERAFFALGR